MRPCLSLYVILLALLVCVPGLANAELVTTLFSWDGGDSERIPAEYPNEHFFEIPTDSLRAVGLPVHPDNGDYVISTVTHELGPPFLSNVLLYFRYQFPEFTDRQDLLIQCSLLYLNTTTELMSIGFVGGDGPGIEVHDPGGMQEWAYVESALEPFTPTDPNGYQWVTFSPMYGNLSEEFYLGYYLLDNISIKVYDTAGVVVEEISVGGLKASY